MQLNGLIPWALFRKPLAKPLKRYDGAKDSLPRSDPILMFIILVVQALYSISDGQAEFVINDRLSFMRFPGLILGDKFPDVKHALGLDPWDDLAVPRTSHRGPRHR